MPASDISRITHSFPPGVSAWAREACASLANQAAKSQIAEQIRTGILSRHNQEIINAKYKDIYYREYYRQMNLFEQSGQAPRQVVYIEDRSTRKFFDRHTVVNFSKLNCFIHVHRCSITVSRYNYPLDGDESPETKEAFVTKWPGPLDKLDNTMSHKVVDYIDTLQQHDSVRRIKYCDSTNDDRREIILNLLRELIRQNGFINAAGITTLLLGIQKTEINIKDKPIETIQKYLLKGKRADAIKFARTKKLFDHAQCLAFLDKYQPPNTANYTKDSHKLKDDTIVLLNDDYINSISSNDHSVLKTVYRSLLNRILETDPESINLIKRPNVVNNNYEFAILTANDCEMDFDQSNEVFKLIRASKRVLLDPVDTFRHLISLGFTNLERSPYDIEPMDDMSNRSHLSFKSGDTFSSRTLTISNFDMLVLNEIWEYCLNLAKRTQDPSPSYEYVTNLIPYKLVFASCLFDFGLHKMFAQYITSISSSLAQARNQQYLHGDPFYDWTTIEKSVEHLWGLWELFQSSPERLPPNELTSSESIPFQSNIYDSGNEPTQPVEAVNLPPPTFGQNDVPQHNNYYRSDWDVDPVQESDSLQSQSQPQQQYQPQQQQQQLPQQQEQHFTPQDSYPTQPFNMEPLANQLHSLPDMSRYHQRPGYPDSGKMINEHHEHKAMKSSSPVNKTRESMGDSFPFSPIQENVEPQSNNSSRRESAVPSNDISNNDYMAHQHQNQHQHQHHHNQSLPPLQPPPLLQPTQSQSQSQSQSQLPQSQPLSQSQPPAQAQTSGSVSGNKSKSQPSGDQQNNLLANLLGSLIPKSNSKQMILPADDAKDKTIVYDNDAGLWIDRSNPNGAKEDVITDAPPMMSNTSVPGQYSLKKRGKYPAPTNFQ